MTARVAVLLPFRDVGAWLDAALTSVRAEPCVDHVMLVNDGSVDDGGAIAQAHARIDPRIEVVHTPPLGLVHALTLARSRTNARYLARMDGDDLSVPGRIAASCAALDEAPSLGAVGTEVEPFGEGLGDGMRHYVAWQNSVHSAAEHRHALFVEAPLCHPSVTLRASALDAVGGYREGPFPEDYDLWLRLDQAGHGLAKLPRLGLRWRQREGRATFLDPRYGLDAHGLLKAAPLAARLAATPRVKTHGFVIWGAGKTGKRLARSLEPHGARATGFIDIDPDKIGRTRRGVPVHDRSVLLGHARPFVVVAVGARGARALVVEELRALGLTPDVDYLPAS